jgi:hypothetical protein
MKLPFLSKTAATVVTLVLSRSPQVVLSRSPLYAYRLPLAAFSQQGNTTHGNQ